MGQRPGQPDMGGTFFAQWIKGSMRLFGRAEIGVGGRTFLVCRNGGGGAVEVNEGGKHFFFERSMIGLIIECVEKNTWDP